MSSLLTCQQDSYLKESVNSVLKCEVVSSESVVKEYALTMKDSVLYPEGGGQVCHMPFSMSVYFHSSFFRYHATFLHTGTNKPPFTLTVCNTLL